MTELTETQKAMLKAMGLEDLVDKQEEKSKKSDKSNAEKFEEIIQNISECYDKNDIVGFFTNISCLGEEIKPICKELAPFIPELTSSYGTALRPIIDQLIFELIKGIKYGNLTLSNVLESTIDEDKKYQEAKAKHHYNKFNALVSAGFTREEAISIFLAEINKKPLKLDQLPSIKLGKKKKSEDE